MVSSLKNSPGFQGWVLGALLFTIGFLVHFTYIMQLTHPTGWDGYYYVMQAHSWIELGYLQDFDYSPVYPFYTFISLLTNNYIFAFKIGTALLAASACVAIFLFSYNHAKSWPKAFFTVSFVIFSPTITFLIYQFPKNTMGLIFFIVFILFLKKKKFVPAIVFFLLTFLTHRMAAGFAAITLIVFFLKRKYLIGIGVALVILTMLSLLPGIIHLSDFLRFNNQFTISPQLPVYAFSKLFGNQIVWFWHLELWLIFLIVITALAIRGFLLFRNKPYNALSMALWIILFLTVFPFFQFSTGSMGFRFFIVSPVIALLLVPNLLPNLKSQVYLTLGLLFLIASAFSVHAYKPDKLDAPN